MDIDEELKILYRKAENWENGVCPNCEGNGAEWPRQGDGTLGRAQDCHICGGSGNIVNYVEELLQKLSRLTPIPADGLMDEPDFDLSLPEEYASHLVWVSQCPAVSDHKHLWREVGSEIACFHCNARC